MTPKESPPAYDFHPGFVVPKPDTDHEQYLLGIMKGCIDERLRIAAILREAELRHGDPRFGEIAIGLERGCL